MFEINDYVNIISHINKYMHLRLLLLLPFKDYIIYSLLIELLFLACWFAILKISSLLLALQLL